MLSVDDLAERLIHDVVPALPVKERAFIADDMFDVDPDMAIDDCMQFTFINGIHLDPGLLNSIEDTVRHAGYDPELLERTLGWIGQHRARNQAAA